MEGNTKVDDRHLRATDFGTRDEAAVWVRDDGGPGNRLREVLIGLDAAGVPVVSHTIEIADSSSLELYAGTDNVRQRVFGSLACLRSYSKLRMAFDEAPFIVKWQLLARERVIELGDTLKMMRLEGWFP